jgi:hypothetical protein
VTERRMDPLLDEPFEDDPQDILEPSVDLQLGGDDRLSGSGEEGLAQLDEENLYGNDVIVDGEFDDDAQRAADR